MRSWTFSKALVAAVGLAFLIFGVLNVDAWARAGGGRSSGSRGGRSFSAPSRPSGGPVQFAPAPRTDRFEPAPRSPLQNPAPAPQPSGGLWRGVAAGLAGGFLGSLLFSGLAGAGGLGGGLGGGFGRGGFGLLEILVLAGLGYALFAFLRRGRAADANAGQGGGSHASHGSLFGGLSGGCGGGGHTHGTTTEPQPATDVESDLAAGLRQIRAMDPAFDETRFRETASDAFFRVQAGYGQRDLEPVRALLGPEVARALQEDIDKLKAEGKINRLENIAVRSVEITEAWQEAGKEYVTVRFLASLLDYTLDERSGTVYEGSRTEPVKFEEYWSFVRPVGGAAWQLSAINQP